MGPDSGAVDPGIARGRAAFSVPFACRPLVVGPAREQLAADEALLGEVRPGGPTLLRWYVVNAPALVLGLAQRQRADEILDGDRVAAAGAQVLERRAGGGLVLLDGGMLCLAAAVPLPHPWVPSDLTESYRWLGDRLVAGLGALGVVGVRRVEVSEARAGAAAPRAADDDDAVPALLAHTCYGRLSPHEVVVGRAKLVGLAQVRRRQAALFQVGILLRGQERLADLVRVPDEHARERLRKALLARTVGLEQLLPSLPAPAELARVLGAAVVHEDVPPRVAGGQPAVH